jgi:DNA polymerase gamma 1
MDTLTINTKPTLNSLGYQMVSDEMWAYLFGVSSKDRPEIDKITKARIKSNFEQFGDQYKFPPDSPNYPGFNFEVPQYPGNLLDFIDSISESKYGAIKANLLKFLKDGIPKAPYGELVYRSGWTRYSPQETKEDAFDFTFEEFESSSEWLIEPVQWPLENYLVFDVETFVKQGNGPVMAVAVSNQAWYVWLHPSVVNPNQDYQEQLISLGPNKVVLNHNVKFDSARVLESYTLGRQGQLWLDTQSMHIAICGMSSKQRVAYLAYKKGQPGMTKWASQTSTNSLIDVYNHHVQPLVKLKPADKQIRNVFVTATSHWTFHEMLGDLTFYNLKDVFYTYELGQALVPKYFQSQPSITTFAGHCILNKSFLPVPNNWDYLMSQIEKEYAITKKKLRKLLSGMAQQLAKDFQKGELSWKAIQDDPWLSQLDWTPAKTGATKGLPLWWRKVRSKGISTKSRLAPILLKMTWTGQPLVFMKSHGWIFKALENTPNQFHIDSIPGISECHSGPNPHFPSGNYSKVPHKKGDKNNCGSPLAKDYIGAIESGLLSSSHPNALSYLKQAKSIAYWTSMRKRALSYKALPLSDESGLINSSMIEPMLLAHGTSSRRCVESLWLTVSGAKPDVIGSELKGLVRAPQGYKMVNSDFDAQELKIASAYADLFLHQVFGSSPMGYTQLLGDKSKGTDGHTLLANYMRMGRSIGKELNFQMLYLSGLLGCTMTIKSQRPELSEADCKAKASMALKLRRGKKEKTSVGTQYTGGTDSNAYNFMMRLADARPMPRQLKHLESAQIPRTPMLGSAMSKAITEANCGSEYLTSRANWTIQSSGVDILHTLVVILEFLFETYNIPAWFMFSYHDEVWTLVKNGFEHQVVWAFQIAHLWTWAYFFRTLGFQDLPYTYQFYSSVNVDTCFRKEVKDSQITPSNLINIPAGQAYNASEVPMRLFKAN